jgi:hypothetical protein
MGSVAWRRRPWCTCPVPATPDCVILGCSQVRHPAARRASSRRGGERAMGDRNFVRQKQQLQIQHALEECKPGRNDTAALCTRNSMASPGTSGPAWSAWIYFWMGRPVATRVWTKASDRSGLLSGPCADCWQLEIAGSGVRSCSPSGFSVWHRGMTVIRTCSLLCLQGAFDVFNCLPSSPVFGSIVHFRHTTC